MWSKSGRSENLRPMTERTKAPRTFTGIRVVLVDDHTMLRQGLRQALVERGFAVIGEASNGHAGAKLVLELQPDVVVMDLHMPQMNGVEAVRSILAQDPAARILMLTISVEEDDVVEALVAGACGYLVKTAPPDEIVAAIQAAHDGDSTVSPIVATRLIRRIRQADPAPDSRASTPLTPRETEILRLIAQGKENSEIAKLLIISPSTAKNHVARVLEKLGVDNRVQAAVYAVRSGIV
jgi:DNA-binding NarL/FixJ family response regulator